MDPVTSPEAWRGAKVEGVFFVAIDLLCLDLLEAPGKKRWFTSIFNIFIIIYIYTWKIKNHLKQIQVCLSMNITKTFSMFGC